MHDVTVIAFFMLKSHAAALRPDPVTMVQYLGPDDQGERLNAARENVIRNFWIENRLEASLLGAPAEKEDLTLRQQVGRPVNILTKGVFYKEFVYARVLNRH